MNTVFLPSPPSQEPIPIVRDDELLDSQPKFPSPAPSVTLPLIEPSLENDPNDLNFYAYVPGEKKKRANERSKKSNKKPKIENSKTSGIFVGYWEKPPEMKEEEKKKRQTFVK